MTRIECLTCGALVKVDFMARLMRRVVCQVCCQEMEIVFRSPLIVDFPDDEVDDNKDYLNYSRQDYDHL
jgi:hypothetical protein